MSIERYLPITARAILRHVALTSRQMRRGTTRTCPICNYAGAFIPVGVPIRAEGLCPRCGSLERQRLVKLWSKGNENVWRNKNILHFAPEDSIKSIFKPLSGGYVTADITPGRADLTLNIESLDLPSNSKDVVICFHVLEHVNDAKALSEIYRILTPSGVALLMVPMIEGWDETYQDDSIAGPQARETHYGQYDHVRWFGRDFRDRVKAAGFSLSEFTVSGGDAVNYGLLMGERLFVARKPI